MTQKAILFIPDISGFTEFVHHTAINHSKHIISELLELLIDSNHMGLTLAEIEGDALFLYKVEDMVNVSEIDKQIETMYLAFHTHLKRYEYQRICSCGACSSAYNLKIKFIVHYGDIDFISVKTSKKPYGSNVIQVHRLLKNDVPLDEYALFTENVFKQIHGNNTLKATYDFGQITYHYKALDVLKQKLPDIKPIPNDVPKHKLYSNNVTIKIPAADLYEVISNFDYRLLWTEGIDQLEYEKNKVNRIGEKHKCLFNKNKDVEQQTITKPVNKNQLVYGESTNNVPFTKKFNNYFVLEEVKESETKLHIEVFADFKRFGIFFKPLMKRSLKKVISGNITKLISLLDSGFSLKNSDSI